MLIAKNCCFWWGIVNLAGKLRMLKIDKFKQSYKLRFFLGKRMKIELLDAQIETTSQKRFNLSKPFTECVRSLKF